MGRPDTARTSELLVTIWFLEAGWELFTPVSDLYGVDLVVREPKSRRLLSVQVKHKEPGALNEGRLSNDWVNKAPPFDYLVFIVPINFRVLVLPKEALNKSGKTFDFYKKDSKKHSCGPVRPCYSQYAIELGDEKPELRSLRFIEFFSKVHASRTSAS